MPLTDIEGRKQSDSRVPLNTEKIKASVSSLPRKVGIIYKEVVEKCLKMGETKPAPALDKSAAEWNAERLQKQNRFYWDVVRKFEDCTA